MKQLVTQAIILARTDYGEADRILTVLTPDQGKLRLLAKGVRRVKSKLAGGIELFSVSIITYVQGRGDIGTLVSTRLVKHYGSIVTDLDRTMLGYELIKRLNKTTEDQVESEYFGLLQRTFEALDDADIDAALVQFWFSAQMIRFSGHTPNLETDSTGATLQATETYNFDSDHMCFDSSPPGQTGRYSKDDIKFLRLSFSDHHPQLLQQIQGSERLVKRCAPLLNLLTSLH